MGDRDQGRAAHPSGAGRAVEVTVSMDIRTAAIARSFAAATLRSWGLADQVDPAAMVLDQFVDAARLQGSPLVDVRVCRTDTGVRVEVIERSHPLHENDMTDRGRPRAEVLDALSSAWGRLAIGSASCLWADIGGAGSQPPRGPAAS